MVMNEIHILEVGTCHLHSSLLGSWLLALISCNTSHMPSLLLLFPLLDFFFTLSSLSRLGDDFSGWFDSHNVGEKKEEVEVVSPDFIPLTIVFVFGWLDILLFICEFSAGSAWIWCAFRFLFVQLLVLCLNFVNLVDYSMLKWNLFMTVITLGFMIQIIVKFLNSCL